MRNPFLDPHKKRQLYYLSQAGGWGFYALINIFVLLTARELTGTSTSFAAVLFTALLGFIVTHGYRFIIHRQMKLKVPPVKIILIGIFSIIAASVFIAVAVHFFSVGIGLYTPEEFRFYFLAANFLNTSIFLFMWALLYFAINTFELSKRSEIERLIWEAAVKDFELKTLKSQLNPHFMFNALNGIRALVEENPERAKTAITELSHIFRYSLKIETTETVPLHEELQTVSEYLSLEQIRYEERLRFTLETDPEARNFEIPPMMIQTLVENGIKHGISKLPEGGVIEVKSFLQNGYLKVIIRNTGEVSAQSVQSATGHGISNTKQRLSLLYGEKADFSIANNNGMVEVLLSMPSGGRTYESSLS